MTSKAKYLILILVLILIGCARYKQRSELTKALDKEVAKHHLSQKRQQEILQVFEKIEDSDSSKKFVDKILTILEMGGDTTHIETFTRTFKKAK